MRFLQQTIKIATSLAANALSELWLLSGLALAFFALNGTGCLNSVKLFGEILNRYGKGQLISKAIYSVLDSPKKRTKKIWLVIL